MTEPSEKLVMLSNVSVTFCDMLHRHFQRDSCHCECGWVFVCVVFCDGLGLAPATPWPCTGTRRYWEWTYGSERIPYTPEKHSYFRPPLKIQKYMHLTTTTVCSHNVTQPAAFSGDWDVPTLGLNVKKFTFKCSDFTLTPYVFCFSFSTVRTWTETNVS